MSSLRKKHLLNCKIKEYSFVKMLCKHRKILVLCSISFLISGLLFSVLKNSSNSLFDEISQEDKSIIEPFLQDLIFNNHFGYVLLDEKPVAIASYFSHDPFINLLFSRKAHAFDFKRCWEVIEKYKLKLNSKNFIFFNKKSNFKLLKDCVSKTPDNYEVAIINKKLFIQMVEKHLNLFRKILGIWVTPINLLTRIAESKVSLFEALNYDEELLGILLGYGEKNAFAFKRSMELAYIVDPYFREIASPFTLHFTKPSPHFHSLEAEYAYLQEQLSFFDLHFSLSPLMPPAFRALKDDEDTRLLAQKYRTAHHRLMKIYYGNDVLKIILNQFLKNENTPSMSIGTI